MANLQTEFSLEDIEIARDVLNTYPCGLSRVALNAPDQVTRISSSCITCNHETNTASITYRTLKMQYALEVWLRAVSISQRNHGPLVYYWWLKWVNHPNGFGTLIYDESIKLNEVEQENLISGFLDLLRMVADSGEIKVHEFCHSGLKTDINNFSCICRPCYEVVADGATAHEVYNRISHIADYNYNTTDVNYTWDDIKEFFSVLTLNQLRLANAHRLHTQTLWDMVLFQGASNCNISMMQYAIDNGANTLSLDSSGESALVSAINNARVQDSDCDTAKIIKTIDFLLSNGADIDAFGADGIPPMMEAYYANSPDLVRCLIERGANVNFNCYLMDCQYWPTLKQIKSSLLYDIENSYDDCTPETNEIERIVREAGGQCFIDS